MCKERLWLQCFEPCAALRAMLRRVFQFIGFLYAFGVPKRSWPPQFIDMYKLKCNSQNVGNQDARYNTFFRHLKKSYLKWSTKTINNTLL
jgi:hypothetical protein